MLQDRRVQQLRERVLELAAAVADPTTGDRTYDEYLRWAGQLYGRYSFGNISLILSVRPESQMVSGYRTWRRLGRQVRYGERGIPIIVPIHGQPVERIDPLTEEPMLREHIRGWAVKHVFDVAQTDGPPMPNWRTDLGEEAGVLLTAAIDLAGEHGIEVEFAPIYGGTNGVSKGGRMTINDARPVGIQAATIMHEIGHERLHPLATRNASTRAVHECEAEAVAYVVLRHYGYDHVLNGSARYCQSYGGSARQILDSLERITDVARFLIDGIRCHLPPEFTPPYLNLH